LAKLPRIKAREAEDLLFNAGFEFIRSKGSHRIYRKDKIRVIIPFHSNKILHPKIVKQILDATEKK
jgi:predicted RNA binding protein YcfA (HicA-like mRNA interferase family)